MASISGYFLSLHEPFISVRALARELGYHHFIGIALTHTYLLLVSWHALMVGSYKINIDECVG